MKSNIALIGPVDLVSLFSLAGIDTYQAKSEDAEDILRKICEDANYLFVLITESVARDTFEFINRINLEGKKYIMVIPDHTGKTELSKLILKKTVEKAVGADILRGDL